MLSPGALDTTFGNNGLVTNPIGPASTLVVYPNTGKNPATDGKIVAGGGDLLSGTPYLVRYDPNGSLDMSFGDNGVLDNGPGGPFRSGGISGLALQGDGKIVAVGTLRDSPYSRNTWGDCPLQRRR